MDVDAILGEIDGWGKYQRVMYLWICLPSLVAGAAVVSLSWTGYDMGHRCLVPLCETAANATYAAKFLDFTTPRQSDPDDETLPWDKCQTFRAINPAGGCVKDNFNQSQKEDCSHWVFDTSVMTDSIISEFGLSCGKEWLATLASSLYMAGMLLGSLFFGYISDRYGRKLAMMLGFLFLGLPGLVSAFSPTYSMFAVMRFFTGMGGMGTFMITFVIAVELVSTRVRTFCGIAIELWFSLGEGLVGVAALGLRDWRMVQIAISVPTFALLVYWVAVTAMVYYGLALNATNLGGDVYVNFVLIQLVDWPGIIICIFILDPWGRKLTTSLGFIIAGLGSIASGLVADIDGLEALTVALALVGKFGAGACFAIVFVYGAELFPTDLRNTGIGIASAAGRIGSICAPFIAMLGADRQILSMSIFGVLSLVAGLVTLFLPETYGQDLPDTMEQAESFGRDQTLCFVPCLVRRRREKALASNGNADNRL